MTNEYRTHDKRIYLEEDRYAEPKEIFKHLVNLAEASNALRDGGIVCDFGCATGEFLYYLSAHFPTAKYFGYDVVPDLVERARSRVPGAEFQEGSVLTEELLPENSIDLAIMQGVHSIFDEYDTCLSNLIRWTRSGGYIYVVGAFNNFPVDVWVKYRMSDDSNPDHREPGWNLFSKVSISRFLDKTIGEGRHRFVPFVMPFDLEPHADDPIRTWTFLGKDGQRLLTNGISLIVNLEILEIRP